MCFSAPRTQAPVLKRGQNKVWTIFQAVRRFSSNGITWHLGSSKRRFEARRGAHAPRVRFYAPRGKLRPQETYPNVPHAPPAPKPAPFRPRNVTRTTPPPNAWEANAGINNQVTKEQRERHFWAFNIFTAWVFRFQNFVSSFLCCSIASFRFSIIYPAPGKCALLAAIYTHTKN